MNISIKRYTKRTILFISLFTCFFLTGQELEKEYGNMPQPFLLNELTVNGSFKEMKDSEIGFPNQYDNRPYSYITLYIDNNLEPFIWYEVKATFSIVPLLSNGTPDTSLPPIVKDLKVAYNPYSISNSGSEFSDLNYLKIENRYGLKVSLVPGSLEVKRLSDNTLISLPTNNVFVKLGFKVERTYSVSQQLLNPVSTVSNFSGTNIPSTINLNWNVLPGAIEYELEWAWVDAYGNTGVNTILPPSQIQFSERDFELNNTRILTTQTSYEIPAIYSKGYLIYRVRAVGRFDNFQNSNYYGYWSSGTNNKTYVSDWQHQIFINTDHEQGKNWQFQASYAEDGKKKEVVSYFDGSLRNRQTVTKVNTDNTTVVGEVIYDAQGRPAIEILPAPTIEEDIHFFSNFNVNSLGQTYSNKDFDFDLNQVSCDISAPIMSPISGSSQYYSNNNNFLNRKNHNFIPNAEGYPFSQIEYTPDNTGRISRKGGVGFKHQLGSNHEMKYFYAVPNDVELNRLFGYSVGDASHYKKNIVVDPNGQVSVSYIDPQGRTIATGLAGGKPASNSLDGLEDELVSNPNHDDVYVDLLNDNPNNNVLGYSGNFPINDDKLVFSKQIGVAGNSVTHQINYNFNKNSYFTLCNTNYPFVYDLSISLKDQCAIDVPGFQSVNTIIGQQTIGGTNLPEFSFSSPEFALNTGTYSLYKELKVNEAALNAYANDYVLKLQTDGSGCYVDPDFFSPDVDIDLCNLTCSDCEIRIGTIASYVQGEFRSFYNNNTFIATATSSGDSVNVTFTNLNDDSNNNLNINQSEVDALIIRFVREWELLKEECDAICNRPSIINTCKLNEDVLLSDLSPNGQYGATNAILINNPDDTNDDTPNPDFALSVFNNQGVLYHYNQGNNTATTTNNTWKFPTSPYQDENGNVFLIKVVNNGTATSPNYDLAFTGSTTTYTNLITGIQEEGIRPEQLNNLSDFILNWKPSFAKALLPYHPEYYYYLYNNALCDLTKTITISSCTSQANPYDVELSSDSYDLLLSQTNSYCDAQQMGLFDLSTLNGFEDIFTNDPYFQQLPLAFESSTQYNLRFGLMDSAISNNYLTANGGNMLITALRMVMCNSLTTCNVSTINLNNLSPSQKDLLWITYKSLYTSFKSKIKHVFINIYAISKNSYNGCIGGNISTAVTNVIPDHFTQKAAIYQNIQSIINSSSVISLCNSTSGTLYIDKIKRNVAPDFGYNSGINTQDAIDQLQGSNDFEYFAQTGNCPLLFDLDILLNGFFKDINYHTTVNATALNDVNFTGNYLSKDFFIASISPAVSNLNSNTFILDNAKIKTIVSGQTISLSFKGTTGATNYNTCATTLTIPTNTNGYTWSNYVHTSTTTNTWSINKFKQFFYDKLNSNPASGIFKFQVVAEIIVGGVKKEIIFTGQTCAAIGECGVLDDGIGQVLDPNSSTNEGGSGCTIKHQFTQALTPFLNKLKSLNVLNTTTPYNLNTVAEYKNSFLAEYFQEDTTIALTTTWFTNGNSHSIVRNGTTLATFNIDLSQVPTNSQFGSVNITVVNGIQNLKVYTVNGSNGLNLETIGQVIPKLDFSCCPLINECDKKHISFVFDVPTTNIINDNIRLSIGKGVSKYLYNHVDNNEGNNLYNKIYYTTVTYGIDTQNYSSIIDWTNHEDPNTDLDINNFNVVVDNGLIRTFNNQTNLFTDKLIIQNQLLNNQSPYFQAGVGNIASFTNTMYQSFGINRKTDVLFFLIGDSSESISSSTSDPSFLIHDMINNAKVVNRVFFIFVTDSYGNLTSGNFSNPQLYMNYILDDVPNLNPEEFNGSNFDTANYVVLKVNNTNYETLLPNLLNNIVQYTPSFIDCDAVGCYTCRETQVDITTPCTTCIPQTVTPIPCNSEDKQNFLSFLNIDSNGNSLTIPGYVVEDGHFDNFCDSYYQYISQSYMYYINTIFNLNNGGSASSYDIRFRTISQFGATFLNYGYNDINSVINEYKQYYDAEILANNQNILNWNNWVNTIYKENHPDICPPAPFSHYTQPLPILEDTCDHLITNLSEVYEADNYNNFLQSKRKEFIKAYLEAALSVEENLDMTYYDQEYQYTLYYYDQAGNLTQTVAPEGVKRFTPTELNTKNAAINDYRNTYDPLSIIPVAENPDLQPNHGFKTQYRYNSLNQLVWQSTPDSGETRFAYDDLGRIIASQNAKQAVWYSAPGSIRTFPTERYSYTRYDELGRINEAGEAIVKNTNNYLITEEGRLSIGGVLSNEVGNDVDFREVTKTIYDINPEVEVGVYSDNLFTTLSGTSTQERLFNNRNRVTGVFYYDTYEASQPLQFNNGIFYNYDVHGNVKEMVTYISKLRNLNCDSNIIIDTETGRTNDCEQHLKRVVYDYDLISGNVNTVTFQPNKIDQFIHKYEYDADNRIVNVKTSPDGYIWEKDANYEYYAHGPLSRVEIGNKQVQGIDYAYTLQGWLKVVNGENLSSPDNDMGLDGTPTNLFKNKDAFGYSLNYFDGDYKAIDPNVGDNGTTTALKPLMLSRNTLGATNRNLYNGNIKQMTTAIREEGNNLLEVQKNNYTYDQLNRITGMNSIAITPISSGIQSHKANSYSSTYSYDRNGNLQTLTRKAFAPNSAPDSDAQLMDSFSYKYNTVDGNNQLTKLFDTANDLFGDGVDIKKNDNELASYNVSDGNTHNYIYDEIGQLIEDKSEKLKIEWRVDGKVSKVIKSTDPLHPQEIEFIYDGLGNRIAKKVSTPSLGSITEKTTYYARDAQGNVLAVYDEVKKALQSNPDPDLYLNSYNVTGTASESAVNAIYVSNDGSSSVVSSTGNLTLFAGNKIILKPGFHAVNGSNVLARIQLVEQDNASLYTLAEHHIYGSSRLGVENKNIAIFKEQDNLAAKASKFKTDVAITEKSSPLTNFSSFPVFRDYSLHFDPNTVAAWNNTSLLSDPLLKNYSLSTKITADANSLANGEYEIGKLYSQGEVDETNSSNVNLFLLSSGCLRVTGDYNTTGYNLFVNTREFGCSGSDVETSQNDIFSNTDTGYIEYVISGSVNYSNTTSVLLTNNGLSYGFHTQIISGTSSCNITIVRGNQTIATATHNFGSGTINNLTLKIEKNSNEIKYYINNVEPISTSVVIPSNTLSFGLDTNLVAPGRINNLKVVKLTTDTFTVTNEAKLSLVKDASGVKPQIKITEYKTSQTTATTTGKKNTFLYSGTSLTNTQLFEDGMQLDFNLSLDNPSSSNSMVVNGNAVTFATPSTLTNDTSITAQPSSIQNRLGNPTLGFDMCYFNYTFSAVNPTGSSITNNFSFDDVTSTVITNNPPQNQNQTVTMTMSPAVNRTLGPCLPDTDGDGIFDIYEDVNADNDLGNDDTDGDGLVNYLDPDDDGDGILTSNEINIPNQNSTPSTLFIDTDNDTLSNHLDVDDDNDGYATWETLEGGPGVYNYSNPGGAYTLNDDDPTDDIPNYLDPANGTFQQNGTISVSSYTSLIGDKNYELSNHLGNVLVVVNDKKIPDFSQNISYTYVPAIQNVFDLHWENCEVEVDADAVLMQDESPIAFGSYDFAPGNYRVTFNYENQSELDNFFIISRNSDGSEPIYNEFVNTSGSHTATFEVVGDYQTLYFIFKSQENLIATAEKFKVEKQEISTNNTVSLNGFNADIISYNDYYPFGMTLPGRTHSSPAYRYGFQGQEKDDELKGEGNSLNYTFRMHDPRVGRFFATDPLESKYPHNSPYAFSENRVIDAVELEGLEKLKYTIKLGIETTSDYVWRDIFGTGISWIDFDWNISNDVELISAEVEESKTLSYEVKLKVPVSASLDRKNKVYKITKYHTYIYRGESLDGLSKTENLTRIFESYQEVFFDGFQNGFVTGLGEQAAEILFSKIGHVIMRTRLGMALDGYISKARTSLVNISQRQLSKFNTATVIFDRVSGKFFFGRNKGIEMSKTKIHPDLEKMLPEKSLNQYKLGNCAECDAVNQALWARKGAKMEDFDMFTKGVKSDGSTFPKIQCDNCQVTFPDIKDYTITK